MAPRSEPHEVRIVTDDSRWGDDGDSVGSCGLGKSFVVGDNAIEVVAQVKSCGEVDGVERSQDRWLEASGVFKDRRGVLQWNTMADGLDWLPENGVVLTRFDLERIFVDLRALVGGTDVVDPNRAYAVDIAIAITQAIERETGGE